MEDLDLLILLLRKLGVLLNLICLTADCLLSMLQFLDQLLLKTAHQGVHHFVSAGLHFKVASEPFNFALQSDLSRTRLLLTLSRKGLYGTELLILTLDHTVQELVIFEQGANSVVFITHYTGECLDTVNHLDHLLLFVAHVLLHRLKPACLSLDNIVDLPGHSVEES